LKGIINYTIHCVDFPAILEGYSNANWNSYSQEIKSTRCYVFTLAGGAASEKSIE